jgi:O-antigen/teichoic acid export membrane protein
VSDATATDRQEPAPGGGLRSRFLVGMSSMVFATLASQMVSFVGILLILRWVTQEEFGVYTLILVIVQFLNITSELGIGSSVVRQIQAETTDEGRQKMIAAAVSASATLCLAAGLIVLIAKPLVLRIYDYELLDRLFWYILPVLFLNSVNGLMYRLLQSIYAYRSLIFVKLLTALSRFGLVVLFLKPFGMGVRGILLADLISGSLVLVVSLALLPGRPRFLLSRQILGPVVAFGFPLYLNSILTYIFARVDVLMIGNMTTAEVVAAVEVARKIPDNLRLLLSASFMAVYFPSVSGLLTSDRKEKAQELTNASLAMMSFAISIVTVTLALLQNDLIVWLFTEKYLFAAWAFSLFGMSLLVGVMSAIMGMTLVAGGMSQAPLRVNVLIVLCNVTGNWFLIPIWGLVGAALSSLAATVLSLPLNLWFLRRYLYKVNNWTYLTPILLAATYWALRYVLHMEGLWPRIVMVASYPFVCVSLSPPLRAGLREVLQHGLSRWTR